MKLRAAVRRIADMTAAADYDRAVQTLRTQKLPAYVSYVETGYAKGLAGARVKATHITVDVATGKIVAESPSGGDHGDATPVTRNLFNPSCYAPRAERTATWNGMRVIAIDVSAAKTCKSDDLFVKTIYADATSGALVGADGMENDDDMQVDLSVHYATFDGYVMPTAIDAHAHGHGWLFWARERAGARYSDYTFTQTRRQSP